VTTAILSLDAGRMTLRCEDPALDESRVLDADATARLEGLAEDYRHALRTEANAAALLTIGRALHAWLDGDAHWLARLCRESRPPLLLEIAVPLRPSPLEHAFLEAPWELLADAKGHLAADPGLIFGPVRRLGLRATPEAPSDHRLSLVFMAAAPEGAVALDHDREERAILDATASIGLDLVVEESGWLPALVDVMAAEGPVDVLHLSCHGLSEGGPRLLLENEVGERAPTTADELASTLGDNFPRRLLFLSACLSADRPRSSLLVGSFAATMIQRGHPAALGWGGSVKDQDATRFAAALLSRLARREPLESATARARHALLVPESGAPPSAPATDWHLARLYLGAKGGGVFIKGSRARRRLSPDRGHSEFLDRTNSAVVVTPAREFVGRRRPLQRILRALRTPGNAGVLIHGMGGHGKSSLAARVAHRLVDHTLVVVTGRFDVVSILEAIDCAVRRQDVTALVKEHRGRADADPASFGHTLRAILEGPCRELVRDQSGAVVSKPLLLVLDNFEDALLPSTVGLHTLKDPPIDAIRAVLAAFEGADTTSGLLITSRHDFTLPDRRGRDLVPALFHEALGSMSPSESEKQAVARLRARGETSAVDPDRIRRCVRSALGNPRLQSLLVLCAVAAPTKCDAMLDQMDRLRDGGGAPDAEELRDFLEDLALDTLIGLLSVGEKDLLRASTLFSIPVPVDVLAKLGEAVGARGSEATGTRLIALGLWEKAAKSGSADVLVNALVRRRITPLGDGERRAMASAIVGALFDRWGGDDGSRRSFAMDGELLRLGIACDDARVVAAVAARAVRGLAHRQEFREAAALGIEVIEKLDAMVAAMPLDLLKEASEACATVGNVDATRRYLARAIERLDALSSEGQPVDVDDHASVLVAQGRRLHAEGSPAAALRAFGLAVALLEGPRFRHARAVALSDIARVRLDMGENDEALKLHTDALKVHQSLGNRSSSAVALGDIARVLASSGDFGAALKLYDEALEVLKDLGDHRSYAATLGHLASLRENAGELSAALGLRQAQLRINQDLHDQEGIANARWGLGRIAFLQGSMELALEHLQTAHDICDTLGRQDAICVIGADLANLLIAGGRVAEAISILVRSRDGLSRFGRADLVEHVQTLIDSVRNRI
jgi:tetratricopeptide (TPR) repeat protein